jgi:hypothetical protein
VSLARRAPSDVDTRDGRGDGHDGKESTAQEKVSLDDQNRLNLVWSC